eukprot:791590-Pleurochrysis_carterae.AAC.1
MHLRYLSCDTVLKTVAARRCFIPACILFHFGLAPHAYSRSASAPLPRPLVASCAWPWSPASAPNPKPPRRCAQPPHPRSFPDRT